MEFQDPTKLKPKAARQLALDLQLRLLKVENCLDDIARAAEIAQYTKQYDVTNAFCRDAEELLKERLTIPEIKQGDNKVTIVETSEENLQKAMDIYKEDPSIDKRKHGNIDGIVKTDAKA